MPTSASSRHLGETNEMVKMIQTRADPADQGSEMGHHERFPPPSLRDRYAFREGTFAGTRANGRDAPKTAIQRQREMLDVMTAAFNRLRVGKSRGLSLIA
jgi:hypothetical protein